MTPAASLALLFLLIVVVVAWLVAVEARRAATRARESLDRSRDRAHVLRSERDVYAVRLAAVERERDEYRRALTEPVDVEPRIVHPALRVVES